MKPDKTKSFVEYREPPSDMEIGEALIQMSGARNPEEMAAHIERCMVHAILMLEGLKGSRHTYEAVKALLTDAERPVLKFEHLYAARPSELLN